MKVLRKIVGKTKTILKRNEHIRESYSNHTNNESNDKRW